MPKEREWQQGLKTMHLDPRVCFFLFFFIFSTYFHLGWPPHHHLTTIVSSTTSNHDGHDKGLKTRCVSILWYFHKSALIPTTTWMCHHATAIFGDNVRQMEAWDDTSRPTGAFFFVLFYILYLFYLRIAATSSLDHHYLHNHLQPRLVLCKAQPEAVSRAKPGPNRPGQAGPQWQLHGGFGSVCSLRKPKPSRQAMAFWWAYYFNLLIIFCVCITCLCLFELFWLINC